MYSYEKTPWYQWQLPEPLEKQYRLQAMADYTALTRTLLVIANFCFIFLGSAFAIIRGMSAAEIPACIALQVILGFSIWGTTWRPINRPKLIYVTALFVGIIYWLYMDLVFRYVAQQYYGAVHGVGLGVICAVYFAEKVVVTTAVISNVIVIGVYLYFFNIYQVTGIQPLQLGVQFGFVSVLGIVTSIMGSKRDRVRYLLQLELDAKKNELEGILTRILPKSIAKRLQSGETRISQLHAEATVLFADLVGFTALAGRINPGSVVEILDEIFRRFDAICARHGVEKIKTIGDAYMAACGCPDAEIDHAKKVVAAAIDLRNSLLDFCQKEGLHLNLRIGIHTGMVIAGVIGDQRFGYDVWGDTVNIASRMESTAGVGEIQISNTTKEFMGDGFKISGPVLRTIKGKGEMQTWSITQ